VNRFAIFAIFGLALASSASAQGTRGAASAAPSQASDSSTPAAKPLNLPAGTAIIAKLVAGLDTAQCKPGDRIDAQVTHDVKVGSQAVIKKGAIVTGKISKVQSAPDAAGLYGLWIVFDSVAPKAGEANSVTLDVQAIAPPPATGNDDINGRDTGALMGGHRSASDAAVDELTARNVGAVALPGIDIAFQNTNGAHVSLLVSKKGNFKLAKNSQVVFRVAAP
jgi:hypothetical protein